MTLKEFSIEFDLLYNNISSNQAPGFTEYEKSVFLTQAQDTFILNTYKGVTGDSFEKTEEVTRYLDALVTSKVYNVPKESEDIENTDELKITLIDNTKYNYKVELSEELMFIIRQEATIEKIKNCLKHLYVKPTTHDSLLFALENPFRGPSENRVLSVSEDNSITLYSKYPIDSYKVTYLKYPYPIILEGVGDEFSIKGKTESKEITWLPEECQRRILIGAVELAKAIWAS